jgi:hypothetical protein
VVYPTFGHKLIPMEHVQSMAELREARASEKLLLLDLEFIMVRTDAKRGKAAPARSHGCSVSTDTLFRFANIGP